VNAIAIGVGAFASNGGAAFGDGANASGSLSAAFGTNASALAASSVAIGSGSVANAPNTVSFGSAGNGRCLTNVAAGINPTDAVNLSQLSSLASNLSANFQSQINGLQTQIEDVDKRARRGIAAAAAISSIPVVLTAGQTSFTISTS
jgi:autotransporter adhesin